MEKWVDISGYEGLYRVSSYGRVFSVRRKDSLNRDVGGRFLSQFLNTTSYWQVKLCRQGSKPRRVSVHRLVCAGFHPNPENKPFVNHKDGDKWNNEASNLEWCTPLSQVGLRTRVELASMFGVSATTISRVATKRDWKHV